MTCVIPSQCHTISLLLIPVVQLIYSSSVEAYLLWKCCFQSAVYLFICYYCKQVIISQPWIAWDILHVMSSVTGNLCNKCPKQSVEQNSSYSDYFNAISGFTSNSRAPGGPVTLILNYSNPNMLKKETPEYNDSKLHIENLMCHKYNW